MHDLIMLFMRDFTNSNSTFDYGIKTFRWFIVKYSRTFLMFIKKISSIY